MLRARLLTLMRGLCLFTAAFCGLGLVRAQADEQSPSGVITVRADAPTRALGEFGATTQTLSQQALNSAGADSAVALARLVPGLSVNMGAATGVPAFTLRAAGLNDITSNVESTVALSQDDVTFAHSVMMRGLLFDLDRVEVAKGPQGERGGRNATGGAINFVSAAPASVFSSAFDWSLDQYGMHDLQGMVSNRLADGVAGRIAGRVKWSDEGYQKSVSRPGDRLGAQDEWAVRGSLALERRNFNALLRVQWDQDHSENFAPAAYDGRSGGFARSQPLPTPYNASAYFTEGDDRLGDWGPGFRPQRRNATRSASAHLNWNLRPGLSLSSISGVGAFDRDERVEVAGVAPEDTRWAVSTHIRTYSEELRLRLITGAVDYLLGGYYSKEALRERTLFGLRQSFFHQALGVNEILLRSRQDNEMAAAFGDVDWRATDRVRFFMGARYTHAKKDWNACPFDSGDGSVAVAWNNVLTPFVLLGNGLPNPGMLAAGQCALYDDLRGRSGFGTFEPFKDKSGFSRLSGRAGLEVALWPDVSVRASVASAAKAGGYNGIATQTFSQAAPYGPESVTAFEVGARKAVSNDSFFDVAVFFNDYRNKQETSFAVTPVGNIPGLTNIPRAKVFGAEASGQWRLSAHLRAQGSLAYTQAQISRYFEIDPIASVYPSIVRFDAKGYTLPNAPKWQGNLSLAYERPIGGAYILRAQTGLEYRSKSYGTADGRNLISDALLVDAQLTIADANQRRALSIWGRNMFDDDYWTSAYRANGVFSRLNGAPAIFGATFSLRN